MYADKITGSMERAIGETERRRTIQEQHNKDNGITPESIKRAIESAMPKGESKDDKARKAFQKDIKSIPEDEIPKLIKQLESQMHLHAANLEFEKAADLRDQIDQLRSKID